MTTTANVDLIADALDVGELAPPGDTGSLNLRPEVLDGLLEVRDRHASLCSEIAGFMRRVVLPRANEIGEALARVKRFYPAGKKGSGSNFYGDVEKLAGIKKAQVCNYMQIHEGWGRLTDYMTELPEGATPITSMRGALEAIRAMNRPMQMASADPEAPAAPPAEKVLILENYTAARNAAEAAGGKVRTTYRCRFTEKPRQLLESLTALQAVTQIPEELRDRVDEVSEELNSLLEDIEEETGKRIYEVITVEPSAPPEPRGWAHPQDAAPVAEAPEEEPEEAPTGAGLAERFPCTPEGLAALRVAIAEAGSGAALAKQFGCSRQAVHQLKARLEKALPEVSPAPAQPGPFTP